MPYVIKKQHGHRDSNVMMSSDKDTRTKVEKHIAKKREWKTRFNLSFLNPQRRAVIQEKIKHYEAMGNERKAAIYRSKL